MFEETHFCKKIAFLTFYFGRLLTKSLILQIFVASLTIIDFRFVEDG